MCKKKWSGYRKVGYLEQAWYIVKFLVREKWRGKK